MASAKKLKFYEMFFFLSTLLSKVKIWEVIF